MFATPKIPTPRDISAHPETFYRVPALFIKAWADQKAARGQTVRMERLTPMHDTRPARLVPPPLPTLADALADSAPRITAYIAARMAPTPPAGGAA